MFFTFSSVRAYGDVTGRPQLWLSSFDPAAVDDPSTAALWLTVQDAQRNNHAAQWTRVLVPPIQ